MSLLCQHPPVIGTGALWRPTAELISSTLQKLVLTHKSVQSGGVPPSLKLGQGGDCRTVTLSVTVFSSKLFSPNSLALGLKISCRVTDTSMEAGTERLKIIAHSP